MLQTGKWWEHYRVYSVETNKFEWRTESHTERLDTLPTLNGVVIKCWKMAWTQLTSLPLGRNSLLSSNHLQYPEVLLIKVILCSYIYHLVSLVFPDHWLPFFISEQSMINTCLYYKHSSYQLNCGTKMFGLSSLGSVPASMIHAKFQSWLVKRATSQPGRTAWSLNYKSSTCELKVFISP